MHVVSHDSETPAAGQQVITACAIIHHPFDGVEKIFLARRASTKRFLPGVWEVPGGHIDFGEHVIVGLKREIQEELEVSIAIGDPFFVFDYTNEIKGSHSLEVLYFATLLDPPGLITLHPDDHSEGIWITKDTLPTLYSPQKHDTDDEFIAIGKAFDLLNGESLNFGNDTITRRKT